MSPLTCPEFYVGPCHAMQIIGMAICTKGVGEGQNLHFFFFKRLRFPEMGRTSNGPKVRNKISCTLGTLTSRARMQKK